MKVFGIIVGLVLTSVVIGAVDRLIVEESDNG